jgi:hypothetical protein
MTQHANRRSQALLVLTLGAAVAVLAACGGGGSTKAGGATPSPSTTGAANTNGGGARGAFGTPPAASGQIAEIDGNTVQVQSQSSGQVAVDVTSKTTYTQTKAATRADVKAGLCITATAPSSTATNGSTPSTTVTATTVLLTQPVQGSCARGGGFGGPRGTGVPTGRPSDFPTNRPSDFPSGRASGARTGNLVAASGEVTAVTGSAITVQAQRRTGGSGSPTTYTATVLVTSATTYLQTGAATQSALVVGLCMSAEGSTASDGTVTATRVMLSPPTNGSCDTGFRRGGFGGFGGTATSSG